MTFTVAVAQMAPKKADLKANLSRVGEAVSLAVKEGADVVVFPETAICGYFLEGGVTEVAVPAKVLAEELGKALSGSLTREVDVVLGFYESAGGHIYNAGAHMSFSPRGAEVVHVHRKFFLPTYGVFDEERFVTRGKEIGVYESRLGPSSILICEDVWHSVTGMVAVMKGAQVIYVLAASPARGVSGEKFANLDRYHRMLRAMSEEHGVWVISSMLVGFEGGKGFTGGSVVVNPFGEIVAEGPVMEEHLLMAKVDLDQVLLARAQLPLSGDLQSVWEDLMEEFRQIDARI
jgi:N-carbamoylputrescine amidase